eukprot:6206683-Pleurochrysis_carterae.AAC.3
MRLCVRTAMRLLASCSQLIQPAGKMDLKSHFDLVNGQARESGDRGLQILTRTNMPWLLEREQGKEPGSPPAKQAS